MLGYGLESVSKGGALKLQRTRSRRLLQSIPSEEVCLISVDNLLDCCDPSVE